jgi:hypothetical protein
LDKYDERKCILVQLIKTDYRIFKYFPQSQKSCLSFCFLSLKHNISSFFLFSPSVQNLFLPLLPLVNPFISKPLSLPTLNSQPAENSLLNPALLQFRKMRNWDLGLFGVFAEGQKRAM